MLKALPQAILFDLDDTILSYSKMADDIWLEICYRFDSDFQDVSPTELATVIQKHKDWFWSDRVRHQNGRLNPNWALQKIVQKAFTELGINVLSDVVREMAATYKTEREKAVSPFPGAIETLVQLHKKPVKLALITNGPSDVQRSKIKRFGITHYFDYILIEGEFGVGKPQEEVYLQALDKLEAKAQETWMVGDNLEWEIEAPQKIGIRGIWVDWADKGLPATTTIHPYRIINAISELI